MDDQSENTPLRGAYVPSISKLCYIIALFDMVQALFFLVQSTTLLVLKPSPYSVLSFLGSIFWILMVILLIVGLWKRRPGFIICWLIFSIIGIIADIFFFIWTISTSEYVVWSQIVEFTLLYFGIIIEWICVYTVYKYCLKIGTARIADQPEEGRSNSDTSFEMQTLGHAEGPKSNARRSSSLQSKESRKTIAEYVKKTNKQGRGSESNNQHDKKPEESKGGNKPAKNRDSLEKNDYKHMKSGRT